MKLFDFFLPDVATASHLRALREQLAKLPGSVANDAVRANATEGALKMRIDDLEKDVGFLVLLLAGLLSALHEKGTLSRDDVARELGELDLIDGKDDGRLNIRVLKQYISKLNG